MRITTHQIDEWVRMLETKGIGFTTTINNGVLLEAMRCYQLINLLDKYDLQDVADIAVTSHEHFGHGMDTDEAVHIAVDAIYKYIMENFIPAENKENQ